MAKEQRRRFLRPVGNPADPDGLFQWMQRYLAHIRSKSYTRQTQWHQERYLRDFIGWCDTRGLATPQQINRQVLEDYLLFLQTYRTRQGEPLQWLSKQSKLIPVRSFFRCAASAHGSCRGALPGAPACAFARAYAQAHRRQAPDGATRCPLIHRYPRPRDAGDAVQHRYPPHGARGAAGG